MAAPPVLTWTIGDVKITRIAESETKMAYNPKRPTFGATPEKLREMDWLYPHFVTEDGGIVMAIQALLVEAPGLRIVVDTCIGNDRPRGMTGGRALMTAFLEDIAAAGFPRESINLVLCTHLHVDHVGWNTMKQGEKFVPTFPNARYLIGRDEYAFWSSVKDAEQIEIMADSMTPVFEAGLVDLIGTDHVISPEIRLTPTLGHTPGHVSVLIESKGQRAMITGDFMHHPCQIGRPEWTLGSDTDEATATKTRKATLGDLADQPILVIGTHFPTPTAGHIRRDGQTYKFAI